VCNVHATSGARLTVTYEATQTHEVEITVQGIAERLTRATPIQQEAEAQPASDLLERIRDRP
jgi:hypothetical protein